MVLVTGATGFVGRHVVRELLARGAEVRCLVRRPDKAAEVLARGVELVQGDVTDPASLRGACAGAKQVVHLVAIIRERGPRTFQAVNVRGTQNVVEGARGAGVEHFIHMSALGAAPVPRYRYTYSKWLGEEAVRQSGLPYTIFRPSVIFGEGFGFVDRLVQAVKMAPGLAPVPGHGKVRFQPVWVGDVARCVGEVWQEGAPHYGKTYPLGGPEYLTYEQMLGAVLSVLGRRARKVHVPLWLLRAVVPVLERVLPDPPVTTNELAQLDFDNITDLDGIERQFGFVPRRFAEGLDYLRRRVL
ncbi:MAG: SDR family oxidoreductase [Desulfotomaculales bacterium]